MDAIKSILIMEELNKEEKVTPPPASGENLEVPNPPQEPGQTPEISEGGEGTAEQLAKLQKQNKELKEVNDKKEKQNSQAGFVIQKLKKKLEDEGINPDDEEKGGISEERVRQMNQESNKPLEDKIDKLGNTLSEIARAGKGKPSQGGGQGGQKPVEKKKAPESSEDDQKLMRMAGLVWDSDKEAYVKKDANGKIIRIYKPDDVAKTIS